MTPLTFSLENALEIVSDERRRIISEQARKDADADGHLDINDREHFSPPHLENEEIAYFTSVYREHENLVYMDAYQKRRFRIERKKPKQQLTEEEKQQVAALLKELKEQGLIK